jgi:hypothetical protein
MGKKGKQKSADQGKQNGKGKQGKQGKQQEERGGSASIMGPPLKELELMTPAVLPPGTDEHWDAMLLGATPTHLAFHNLFESRVFAINGFLTPAECQAWISYGEHTGFEEAKQAATSGYALRDNGRLVVHDQTAADAIWTRIRSFVPETADGKKPAGCLPNLRLYKYSAGQRFGKHVDEVVQYPDPSSDDGAMLQTQHTLLLYLNGGEIQAGQTATADTGESSVFDFDLRGGETNFYKGSTGSKLACSFAPIQGWALFHGHGDECMLHEGALVRQGTKYLLRTDVLFES